MIKRILHIILFFCFLQQLYPQNGDGVVAFDVPVRNSLKFNRYIINPTFSFVREQNKYLSFNNKREWVQFDDAPQTYLFGYAGRFDENIGAGLGLFQQNYGVMTTFGGVANFAYNAVFDRESNLTFGLNLGFYKSGINEGRVVTNNPDSSLENVPSNSVITINPGVNYGTGFFDFGVSINNLVAYNLTESKMIDNNPKQGIQGHLMYTGYVNSRGFFDESRFTGLLRSEFRKEETIISGTVMLMVPKGIWAQAGYNTLYGVSAGLGLNITSQIAVEYNYEKAIGDLSSFGNSHDITLAYKFKSKYRYRYNGDDEEQALLIPERRPSRKRVARKRVSRPQTKSRSQVAKTGTRNANQAGKVAETKTEVAKQELEEPKVKPANNTNQVVKKEELQSTELAAVETNKEEEVRLAEEAKVKAEQEEQARLTEEARVKAEQEEQARLAEAARIKAEQEEQARLTEEARVKAEQAEQARLAEEARVKAEQEEQARLAEEAGVKAEQEEQARLAEAARVKAEQEEQARLAEEAKVKAEKEEQARLAEAARVKAEQEEQARLVEEARVKAEQEEQARLAEEAKLKTEQLEPIVVDAATQEMSDLAKSSTAIETEQQALLEQLVEKVAIKQKDLEDLKKENDLSEQGIYQEPKAFKSVSAENTALEALKTEIDNAITIQNEKISELEALYQDRFKKTRDKNDAVGQSYLKTISSLKQEQAKIVQSKEDLYTTLSEIKVATEIERKRRIKRALYDNQEDRYNKDRAALQRIKKFTEPSDVALTSEDFDSGEELSNIQIVKDVAHADEGYYLVVAVHSDVNKRDDFLTKAVAAGRTDINFFFDVNTSKYYIYYEKFDDVNQARLAIENKGTEPYNSKMSMVKIEK